ncbi:MAG: hypothetical protein FWC26_15265 [Fibromonadales bacterium]|nr:hypothetical protein [Fibromonadales bacterium]
MTKFRFVMLLSLMSIQSAFAAAVDALPYTEYLIGPIALVVFSFLVLAQFIFFSEKNKKHRKILLVIFLFLLLSIVLIVIFDIEFFAELGIIAVIINFITSIVLICTKKIKPIWPILVITFAIVTFIVLYDALWGLILALIANAMLGVMSIVALLMSLYRNKSL